VTYSRRVHRLLPFSPLALLSVLSCGGAPVHTDAPVASGSASADEEASAPAPSESAAPPAALPTSCSVPNGDVCTPTDDFVTRLCNARFLEATFVLFSKGSAPWTRGYLRGTVEAWNASGGASLKAKLFFDEEVLVLRRRKPAQGGIVVGDQGGYDVLRWDGYCYSLDAGEVTMKPPPQPRRGHVAFFDLAKPTQDALLATPAVTKAYAKRMKECGGATVGDVTAACEKAENALSDTAIEAARSSSTLPIPEKLP
jgi:hypothetical protein